MPTQSHRRAMLLLILLSGLIIALCMGLRQSLGLFMRPMTLDLGVSAAAFGFSIALEHRLGRVAAVRRRARRPLRPQAGAGLHRAAVRGRPAAHGLLERRP